MSDSSSSSSSSERERDWQAIVEELKREKSKVKMLEGKLVDKEKSSAAETRSPRRSPRRPAPRRSPRQSPRRSPRRPAPPSSDPETPLQNAKKPQKRQSDSSESPPVVRRRLSLTPKTRTPKEYSLKRIRKVLGLAIKMNLDKKILQKAYRCCA